MTQKGRRNRLRQESESNSETVSGKIRRLVMFKIKDLFKTKNLALMALLVAANVVFPIYDIAVSRVAAFYIVRLHPQIRKIIKIK